jgi:hypothetical protein
LQHDYPHYTPYQYAGNMPITYIDLDGLEPARPPMNRNNRPVYNRNGTSNYARNAQGNRLPSTKTTNKTIETYMRNQNTAVASGARITVSIPTPEYIKNVTTAGGNNVQMTPNNMVAEVATLIGELSEIYVKDIITRINTPYGLTSTSSTEIGFANPETQRKYIQLQQNWEKEFERISNSFGEFKYDESLDGTSEAGQRAAFEFGKYFKIIEVIGERPSNIVIETLQNDYVKVQEKIENPKVQIIPEFRRKE